MKELSTHEVCAVSGGFDGVDLALNGVIAVSVLAVAGARAFELQNTLFQVGAFVVFCGSALYSLYRKS